MKTFFRVAYTTKFPEQFVEIYFEEFSKANQYFNDVAKGEYKSDDALIDVVEFSDSTQFVWILSADDHDYDYMSQWFVGVFSDYANAVIALETDLKSYATQNNISIKNAKEKVNYYFAQHRVE